MIVTTRTPVLMTSASIERELREIDALLDKRLESGPAFYKAEIDRLVERRDELQMELTLREEAENIGIFP